MIVLLQYIVHHMSVIVNMWRKNCRKIFQGYGEGFEIHKNFHISPVEVDSGRRKWYNKSN